MFDPPIPEALLDQVIPTIWQLTGVPQPNLANPSKPWDRATNPYLVPATNVAENAAKTFSENWQSVQVGVNAGIQLWAPNGPPNDGGPPLGNPPPGWHWAVPWTDPHGPLGYPYATWGSFQNGIQPGLIGQDGSEALPLFVFVPANVWPLLVDQFDPKEWDTKPSTEYPFPMPPVQWSNPVGHGPYGFTQP
jgi:hypothetical protein